MSYQFLKPLAKSVLTWKFEAFVPIYYKMAVFSIFSKICQKCILLGRYFLTPQAPGKISWKKLPFFNFFQVSTMSQNFTFY